MGNYLFMWRYSNAPSLFEDIFLCRLEASMAKMAEELPVQLYRPSNILSCLEEEQTLLEKLYEPEKFPIRPCEDVGELCFEKDMKFENGNVYRLRICINIRLGPFGYPDYPPDLLVCDSPKPMPVSREWNGSHETHTLPRKHGLLRICHFHPAHWNIDQETSKIDLRMVFNKGKEWLEAYEKHLKKNQPMNKFLQDMNATEEVERKFEEKRRQTVANLEKWAQAFQQCLNPNIPAIADQSSSNNVYAWNDANGLFGFFCHVLRALQYLNSGSHSHGPNIIIRAERIQDRTRIFLTSTSLTSLGGINQTELCQQGGRIQNQIAIREGNAEDFHKLVFILLLKVHALASGVNVTGSRTVTFGPFIPVNLHIPSVLSLT